MQLYHFISEQEIGKELIKQPVRDYFCTVHGFVFTVIAWPVMPAGSLECHRFDSEIPSLVQYTNVASHFGTFLGTCI